MDRWAQKVSFITDVRMTPRIGRLAMSFMPGASRWRLAGPLLFLLSVLAWPAGALYRRVRRCERPVRTPFELRVRWAAGVVFLLATGFLVGLAWVVASMLADNPIQMVFGMPASAAPLFVMPWLLLVGGLVLVALAGLAWRWGHGRPGTLFARCSVGHHLCITALRLGIGMRYMPRAR